MSSIKVKETRASKLRAARNYSTRSSISSQATSEPGQKILAKSPVRSTVNKQKKKKQQQVWICKVCTSAICKSSASIGCDGNCKQWFHPSCVNLTEEEFSTFQNTPDSSWKCSDCTLAESSGTLAQSEDTPGPLTQVLRELRMAADQRIEEADSLQNYQDMTSNLPPVDSVTPSDQLQFGEFSGVGAVKACNQIYNEIVIWKRNLFMLPTGNAGKCFLEEMTKLINAWTSKSNLEPAALTMLMILPGLLLQKPSKRSKSADHKRVLLLRIAQWKEGKIDELVREGRAIQDRLGRSKHVQAHTEKVFSRLMMQGKVSAAMRWIGTSATGILDASEEVIQELIKKHPKPKLLEKVACCRVLWQR